MRAETAGWTGGEDKEIQSTELKLNLDLGPNEEDGAEWVGLLWQSLQSQISIAGLGQR